MYNSLYLTKKYFLIYFFKFGSVSTFFTECRRLFQVLPHDTVKPYT